MKLEGPLFRNWRRLSLGCSLSCGLVAAAAAMLRKEKRTQPNKLNQIQWRKKERERTKWRQLNLSGSWSMKWNELSNGAHSIGWMKWRTNELREAASKANQLQLSSPAARDEELELSLSFSCGPPRPAAINSILKENCGAAPLFIQPLPFSQRHQSIHKSINWFDEIDLVWLKEKIGWWTAPSAFSFLSFNSASLPLQRK